MKLQKSSKEQLIESTDESIGALRKLVLKAQKKVSKKKPSSPSLIKLKKDLHPTVITRNSRKRKREAFESLHKMSATIPSPKTEVAIPASYPSMKSLRNGKAGKNPSESRTKSPSSSMSESPGLNLTRSFMMKKRVLR